MDQGCLGDLPSVSGDRIPLYIAKQTKRQREIWHAFYQPVINRRAEERTDKGWNWPRLHQYADRLGNSYDELTFAVEHQGLAVPIALILLHKTFPYLPDQSQKSSYLWFFSTAPNSVLGTMLPDEKIPTGIGKAVLHTVIARSLTHGHSGRIGLHAAISNPKLERWYERSGLLRLEKSIKLQFQFSRKQTINREKINDGRYFYCTAELAPRLIKKIETQLSK